MKNDNKGMDRCLFVFVRFDQVYALQERNDNPSKKSNFSALKLIQVKLEIKLYNLKNYSVDDSFMALWVGGGGTKNCRVMS